jgi:hypothetical protein
MKFRYSPHVAIARDSDFQILRQNLEPAISGVPTLKIDGKPRNSGSEPHVNLGATCTRVSAVKSQAEDYRAKAKEYARLTVVTKSLREGRRYRKLAEMYWALALGEESKSVRSSKMVVKPRSS